jgi:hypothetical protein
MNNRTTVCVKFSLEELFSLDDLCKGDDGSPSVLKAAAIDGITGGNVGGNNYVGLGSPLEEGVSSRVPRGYSQDDELSEPLIQEEAYSLQDPTPQTDVQTSPIK